MGKKNRNPLWFPGAKIPKKFRIPADAELAPSLAKEIRKSGVLDLPEFSHVRRKEEVRLVEGLDRAALEYLYRQGMKVKKYPTKKQLKELSDQIRTAQKSILEALDTDSVFRRRFTIALAPLLDFHKEKSTGQATLKKREIAEEGLRKILEALSQAADMADARITDERGNDGGWPYELLLAREILILVENYLHSDFQNTGRIYLKQKDVLFISKLLEEIMHVCCTRQPLIRIHGEPITKVSTAVEGAMSSLRKTVQSRSHKRTERDAESEESISKADLD